MDCTLPEFLAYALALEREAVLRYRELAEAMASSRDGAACALFRDMADQSRRHHDSIARRTSSMTLPALRASQHRWCASADADEAAPQPGMDARSALDYARSNEKRALDYYSLVGQRAVDPEVRRLAAVFAAEETEHLDALEDWLARTPGTSTHESTAPPCAGR